MEKIKWSFLGFAFLAAASISGIGIAIGERSIFGVLVCITLLLYTMKEGFKRKKRDRKKH
ncbi:YlaF family protein [Bacillus sp. FJAT-27445]|uniref:YlaF family protein n=1 Tax=Bacillus sp. FJAT-27445 TaxID=1679166 RepID=UPI000743678C|nr:YlaF family protein [Bacillus sp. FJAT-27445]